MEIYCVFKAPKLFKKPKKKILYTIKMNISTVCDLAKFNLGLWEKTWFSLKLFCMCQFSIMLQRS